MNHARDAPARLLSVLGELLAELRGRAPAAISLDDELERGLGIDSLARTELMLRLEREFGVRLNEAAVHEAATPRDLLRDGSWWPRRHPLAVRIDASLRPQGSGWSDALALRDAARRRIAAACAEPDLA